MSTMWTVIDKVYSDLRQIVLSKRKANQEVSGNTYQDSEDGFQITTVENWFIDSEIKKITPAAAIKVQLVCDEIIGFIHPNINIVVEKVGSFGIGKYVELSKIIMRNMGMKIVDEAIEENLNEATIKIVQNHQLIPGREIFNIQKIVIKNRKAYVITITQLDPTDMVNSPEVTNNIKEIIQSFGFINTKNS